MDSNTCNYHRGANQGIAPGYVSNENVLSVGNYGSIRGEYNANPTSSFYLPTSSGFSSISTVSSTGQVNPTSNYTPCEHLLNSYACLEPSVSKGGATSHTNTFSNIVAPYIGNADKGNNLNDSGGVWGDYSSKGLTQSYDRSRGGSCVQCACWGRNADHERGTLDAGLLNRASGPFLGYGVYSASGGTHPSASAKRALINISSVSHAPENANVSLNTRENLTFNAGRTYGNAIAQGVSGYSGSIVAERAGGSSQVTSAVSLPSNAVSLPSNPLSTHVLDANANAFQPLTERVRSNGETPTHPSNAPHNAYDYIALNQLCRRQCTAPFNYPSLNGCLLRGMNSSTANSITELTMKTTGSAKNNTSGSFPSDGNPFHSSAISLSGGENINSAAAVNPNRIGMAVPTISIVSPHPSETSQTGTACLTAPGMCIDAPIPCVSSPNVQMNSVTPGRPGLNLNILGNYPEVSLPLRDVEMKNIIYRNGGNRRSFTNEVNPYTSLRVNNEVMRTTLGAAIGMGKTGRNSHSYLRGNTNESVRSNAGRRSHRGRSNHTGRSTHTRRSTHTVYPVSETRTGGISRGNEYREEYGGPPSDRDFLYARNRKSYTQMSEAMEPGGYKEENMTGRTNRPMDRYTHLREGKILNKRSYDLFAHSANEPREKKGFSSFHHAPNVKRISTHRSSRGRNTLGRDASSAGESDSGDASDSGSDAFGDGQIRRSYKEGRPRGRRGGRKRERKRENNSSDTASSGCSFSDDEGVSSERKRPTVIEFLNAKWNRGSYNEEDRGGSEIRSESISEGRSGSRSEGGSESRSPTGDHGESCSLNSSVNFAKKRKKDSPGGNRNKRRNSNFEEAWKGVGASQPSDMLSSNGDEKTRGSECIEGDSDRGDSPSYSEERMQEGMDASGLVDTGEVVNVDNASSGSGSSSSSGRSGSGASRELHRKTTTNRMRKGKNGRGAISEKTKRAGGVKGNIKGVSKSREDKRSEVDSEGVEEHIENEDNNEEGIDKEHEKNDASVKDLPKEGAGKSLTSDDHSGNDPSTDSDELDGSMSSSDHSEKDGFHSADGASGEENFEVGEEEVEDSSSERDGAHGSGNRSDGEVGEAQPGEDVQKGDGASPQRDTQIKKKKSKMHKSNVVKGEPNVSYENEQKDGMAVAEKDETGQNSSSAGCTSEAEESDTERSESETTSNYESAEESSEYLLDCSSDEITRTEDSSQGSGNSEVHVGGDSSPVRGAKDSVGRGIDIGMGSIVGSAVGSGMGNDVRGSAPGGATLEEEPDTCASSLLRVCSGGVKMEKREKSQKTTEGGEVKVIKGSNTGKEGLQYTEVHLPSGVKCFQTEWQPQRSCSGGLPRNNKACIIRHDRKEVYTNMKSLNYINTNQILRKIKKNVIKEKNINICEWIILLSYVFYKKSRYLDFNKIYLYNVMKRLSPFLLKLNRKCNDMEIRSLFFYLSKVFILDDYFIFRVNIFTFNWFLLYVYKMKLKNVHFIEDLNLLINLFCGFLTNRRFLNYSLLFLINVVLQNVRGRCLYLGGNYNYVCSLYVSFFSKVVCLAARHRGALRGQPKKETHKRDITKWDTPKSEVPEREKCKLESRTDGMADQRDPTIVHTLSGGIVKNDEHAGARKRDLKKEAGSPTAGKPTAEKAAPSKRQDLILLYVLYVSRNNFAIYVSLLKHILDDILKFKLTYSFHRVKMKTRAFYRKIIRCLKNVKKVMNRSGKRRRRRSRRKRGEDNREEKSDNRPGKSAIRVGKWDDHANVNYSFVYLLIGVFLEYTSFSFTPSVVSFFKNEKLEILHRELFSHLKQYTDVTFRYMKFYALDMMRVYPNIWLRNVFTTVNLKKMDGLDDANGEVGGADGEDGQVEPAHGCLSLLRGGESNGWRRRRTVKRNSVNTDVTEKGGLSTTTITAMTTTVITLHGGCDSGREEGGPDKKGTAELTQKDDSNRRSGVMEAYRMDTPREELQNGSVCDQKDPSHKGNDESIPLDSCSKGKKGMEHCEVDSFKGEAEQQGEGADGESPGAAVSPGEAVSAEPPDTPLRKTAKMEISARVKISSKSEPPNALQKNPKGNHYTDERFVDATLFMLCRCLKLFRGSVTLSTLFDVLFLSFLHRIDGDRLKRFLVEVYTTDKDLSGLVTKIIFRSVLREECFRNVCFVNYFLARREPLHLPHLDLGGLQVGLQVGLADVCAFYLRGFRRCGRGSRRKSKQIGRRSGSSVRRHPRGDGPTEETNYLNAQLHLKPCPCMFLMYVLFFSSIFQNFKMYFMHFTKFSYSLQRRVMTKKGGTKRGVVPEKESPCLEWGSPQEEKQHGYRCHYCERGSFSDGALEAGKKTPKSSSLNKEKESISKGEEVRWSRNVEEVMEKYHLISLEDGINMLPFKGSMKKCSSPICVRAKQKESAVMRTMLENVKIREDNSMGNSDPLFSERTAHHILSVLYEQRRMRDVQLGSVFARIDGGIFNGQNFHDRIFDGHLFDRRVGGGRTKGKLPHERNPRCETKDRIRERYRKILSGVLKWNKKNIAYNKRKEEGKQKATLKRRRNKYTNIIFDVYPLIFLSLVKLLKATISINDDVKDKCFDVKNEEFPVQLHISVELNKNEEALKIHQKGMKCFERSKWQYSFVRRCPCSGIPLRHSAFGDASSFEAPSHPRPVTAADPKSSKLPLGRTNSSLNLAIKLLYREIRTDFYIWSEYYDEKVHLYRTLLILLLLKYLSSGLNLSSFRRRFVLFFTQRLFRLLCFRVMCLFLSDVHLSRLTSEILVVDEDFLVKSYQAKRQKERRSVQRHRLQRDPPGGAQLSPRRSRFLQKKSYNRYKRYSENFLFNVQFLRGIEVGREDVDASEVTTANVTTANVTTANVTTANVTTANVTTANVTTANVTTANVTTANVTTANVTTANVTTANVAAAKRTVYKPFVPFGSLVMTKREILKLKLQRREEIKKENLYIDKSILKGKSRSKSKGGPEMENQMPSEEKHSVQLSIVSIILLMNCLRKNSNYSSSINFYLSLLVDKFLEKKKYIHLDEQYLVHSYVVNLQNPLQMNCKRDLFSMSEKNSWVRRKFELINSGYRFCISSRRFPILELLFYESLKVYLTFLHKNTLGALVCKMSKFNSMYAGMNRNLHFGMKINQLLCCKLNTLLIEEHLNMRLTKSISSVTYILSACKFLFISMLDETENCDLAVPLSGRRARHGENPRGGEAGQIHQTGQMPRVCLSSRGDDSILGRHRLIDGEQAERAGVEGGDAYDMRVDQSEPSGGGSHGKGPNVAKLRIVANGTSDPPRRYNPNENTSGRLVVGNCRRDYLNSAVGTLQSGEVAISPRDTSGGWTQREGQITPQWCNSYRAYHVTIEQCTRYRIEHYHREEGRSVPMKKKAAIYMKPDDVNKLITSFEQMNRTILDCTDFIYELYFASERDDPTQEEKEKRNRHIYTWFESCLNVLTFEKWVVHQLYNKFDNVTCIYTLKRKKTLTSHVVRINSHILRDIAKVQNYFEDRFDHVKKACHADRAAKNEENEPICIEDCASRLDAMREQNCADVAAQLGDNTEELAKPEELIEDYDELNSFIDFGEDLSSGMLLQGRDARALEGEVREDVQRLDQYKVDEGWLTYIRSLI
ncbi:hypothetical protein C922_03963 [Plasmodium inui San Antonio 1]|uniref:Uncharacterized protein n=1 Tax=Plasmodium inui San Antonio 1 TaxID=1237626 RepID=W7A222_9APIC|nr:hypothetical protein C922_03963 [Plasmodium inui San Antonio 1]EUD65715.1 hypothetical protein C922_03963 [Plasmodium inui San Antonio 1]